MFGILVALTICSLFKRKPKTISFNRLPILVRIEVIRSLGYEDSVKLAMTSKRSAETVRVSRIKPSYAVIEISSSAYIKLGREEITLLPNLEENKVTISDVMKWKEMDKRTDQSSNSIVEDAATVYNEIRQIFRCEIPFLLIFPTDHKTVTTVEEVLSDPTLQNWSFCHFKDKKISSEELKMILDMASSNRSFVCSADEGPRVLRHEKAFKCRNIMHIDARWVKIEDLYGINNCGLVTLGRTNLTQSDMKTFISYWVNSDIDMFWRLKIGMIEDSETVDMLDGLTVLHIENSRTWFTKAKSSETRKKTLLCFSNMRFLTLSAWAPDQFTYEIQNESFYTRGEFDMMIRKKHGVIDLLMEKKQLESEEGSANQEDKRRIWKRLKQLDNEIQDYGVFYVDGRATLSAPTQ